MVKSPDVGGPVVTNDLYGVAAVSARDVWAVGYHNPLRTSGTPLRTLIEHWDGTKWTVVPSPTPGWGGNLNAVAVTSADSVCVDETTSQYQTLGAQLIGNTWTLRPTPNK